MKIETGYLRLHHLYDDIKRGGYIVPSYQREYCWGNEKIELFIDSLVRNIPIGVFQFRKREGWDSYEIVDGLHRIRTIFNILLGRGVYFNFETCKFTLNPNDFDYSKLTKDISPLITIFDESGKMDFDRSVAFHKEYIKIRDTEILKFVYYGTDKEVELAFSRINEAGVTFTPIFKKVEKEAILTI